MVDTCDSWKYYFELFEISFSDVFVKQLQCRCSVKTPRLLSLHHTEQILTVLPPTYLIMPQFQVKVV